MALNRLRSEVGKQDHGKLWETKVAPKLSARLRPASGAMVGAKGDFASHLGKPVLFEAKSTTGKTLAVEFGWLVKITSEALKEGKTPALVLGFVQPDGRPRPNCESEWVAVPITEYQEMMEVVNAARKG
jgi:hypothetical protein